MIGFFLGAANLAACGGSTEPVGREYGYLLDDTLRLTDLQVRGTHNSYHLAAEQPVRPEFAYSFPSLDVQLRQYGIRAFELDLHHSEASGYEVYHAPVFDEDRSNCRQFRDCLGLLKAWSDENPGHVPLFITMEFKDTFDREKIADYDGIDAEILSVWPRERLLVPDDIQKDAPTLAQAVQENGWPTLRAARDKAMFLLIDRDDSVTNSPPHRSLYSQGGTSLRGRIFFVTEDDNLASPLAAAAKIEDGSSTALIAQAHRQRMLLGLNIDGVNHLVEDNLTTRRAGLASGVQLLYSDFLAPPEGPEFFSRAGSSSVARCNPVTAPPSCTDAAIENLAQARAYLLQNPR